jgi:hypothetical protein
LSSYAISVDPNIVSSEYYRLCGGKKHEHQGIARDGAKLIHAVANSVVPKYSDRG